MKYDLNKKMTLGAKRVLDTFSRIMIEELAEKNFEDVTVGELCEKAMYPRATFYNYFDDKYDLFSYCLSLVLQRINIEDYGQIAHDRRLYVFFDRFYDIAVNYSDIIRKIFKNDINGLLMSNTLIQLNTIVLKFVEDCEFVGRYPIPYEMISQHYANTIMLVFRRCFETEKTLNKEQALYYLEYLLRDI